MTCLLFICDIHVINTWHACYLNVTYVLLIRDIRVIYTWQRVIHTWHTCCYSSVAWCPVCSHRPVKDSFSHHRQSLYGSPSLLTLFLDRCVSYVFLTLRHAPRSSLRVARRVHGGLVNLRASQRRRPQLRGSLRSAGLTQDDSCLSMSYMHILIILNQVAFVSWCFFCMVICVYIDFYMFTIKMF